MQLSSLHRFLRMELVVGIEPTTPSLRVTCSTIEPHQQKYGADDEIRTRNPRLGKPMLYH